MLSLLDFLRTYLRRIENKSMERRKLKIGITTGDLNGIGLEVILKSFANPAIFKFCMPIVYGSTKVVSYHRNIVNLDSVETTGVKHSGRAEENKVNVINCWNETININLGKETVESARAAILALERATQDLKQGYIDAVVTAPINKKTMKEAGFQFPGHTEYFDHHLDGKSLMLMINDSLRVGLVTGHMSVSEVASSVTKEAILSKLSIMESSLKKDFGIERPIIAVLALNPHAGDGGMLGLEEIEVIRPAIIEAKKKGQMVMGPFPADGFFGSGAFKKYDGILAMYHDQGLVPFKALSFNNGVNFTAGLNGVRTSPDHGVAYDLAGNNEADPSSFRKAIYAAIDIVRNRKTYEESTANPLQKLSGEIEKQKDEILEEGVEGK